MDDAVREYIDAIAPEHRPLFDRLHRLILEVQPDVAVVLSYQIPTHLQGWPPTPVRRRVEARSVDLRLGARPRRRLHRPPPRGQDEQGDIQLRPEDAAAIPDEEFRNLIHAVLDG